MSGYTVAVLCRVCRGSGNGEDGYCGWCKAQGHESINRNADGSTPTTHDTGEPVVEWIPATLPETPATVWTLAHGRCC